MSEKWLTGSEVREMNDQMRLGLPPLGQPDNGFYHWSTTNVRRLLDDNKRLVELMKRLERDRSIDGGCRQCGSRARRCSDDCPYKQARACLKAQGE